ncbi:hypothetical protein SEA_ZOOMAN_187 [Microbacterium phage Zooman]|nr:hypothetical protein SEA_ZOOMAN_187 [Microbacterium phage Zooman]
MEPTVAIADETTEKVEVVERPLSDTLNHSDRCDACGAQAFVWINMPNSTHGLLYCSHHFNRFEAKLREHAIDVIDERYKINVKASASSF